MNENRKVLLSLRDVEVKFHVRSRVLTAIRGVSFDIFENESLAIVGESGSGKSVLTKTFTGMLESNGFISKGSIFYSDDGLAKTDVKFKPFKVVLYNFILNYLNAKSAYYFGKDEYNQVIKLKDEYRQKEYVSNAVNEDYEHKISELDFKIVELFNQKQTLERNDKAGRVKIDFLSKKLLEDKKVLEEELKAIKKKHKKDFINNREYIDNYKKQIKELKIQRKAKIQQEVTRAMKDANAQITKELFLSLDRFPVFTKIFYYIRLCHVLSKAYKIGTNLQDPTVLNELFEKATFRVQFLNIEADIYKELSENKKSDLLADAHEMLESKHYEKYFGLICDYAKNNNANEHLIYNTAEAFIKYDEKDLTEKKISHILSKVYRNSEIKTGNIIHGYAVIDLAKIRLNRDWQQIRGSRIATVFQDPMTSLNPIIPIGKQISEVIVKHHKLSEEAAKKEAIRYMTRVGIPEAEKRYNEYPYQYSGGMRQRIVIAIALACQPKVLICDEPTTALDVTIQAQIIALIKDLQKEFQFTTIYITHDLGVVASVADRVAVLYAGQLVECGLAKEVFYNPQHPYTWALLSSLPQLAQKGTKLYSIPGTPPSLYNLIHGDAFAERNPYCMAVDLEYEPPYFHISDTHFAKTWLLDPRAPKVKKPEVIEDIHEKLKKSITQYDRGEYEYEKRAKQRSSSISKEY